MKLLEALVLRAQGIKLFAATIDKKLTKLRKQTRAELDLHMKAYGKHKNIDQLKDDLQDSLSEGYAKAYKLGLQKKNLTPQDKKYLQFVENKQFDYLDGMLDDIENGTSKMPISNRLDMYTNHIDSLFWYGSLKGKNKQIYWNLDAQAENCPDCIELADNSPYDPEDLPTVPRGGDTECLMHCKCFLSHKPHGFFWG